MKNKNQRKLHQHKDSVSQAARGSAEVQVEEVSRQFPRMETCLLNPPRKETERFFQRGACSVFSIVYLEGCDMQSIEIATSSETDLSFYFCFDQLPTFWLCVTLHMSIFNMQKARGWESSASLQVFIPAKNVSKEKHCQVLWTTKGQLLWRPGVPHLSVADFQLWELVTPPSARCPLTDADPKLGSEFSCKQLHLCVPLTITYCFGCSCFGSVSVFMCVYKDLVAVCERLSLGFAASYDLFWSIILKSVLDVASS